MGTASSIRSSTGPRMQRRGPATEVAFLNSIDNSFHRVTLSHLGGPTGSFKDPANARRHWIDVNGDGLPDIFEPGTVWINQGGSSFDVVRDAAKPTSLSPGSSVHAGISRQPARVRVRHGCRCRRRGRVDGPRGACGRLLWWRPRDFQAAPGRWRAQHLLRGGVRRPAVKKWRPFDKSLFRWNAYRFVQAADGSFTMAEIVTNLQAIINDERRVQIDDFDGRGTSSVAVKLMNGLDGFNRYELWPLDQLGLYRSRKPPRLPTFSSARPTVWASSRPGSTSRSRRRPCPGATCPEKTSIRPTTTEPAPRDTSSSRLPCGRSPDSR